MYRGKPKFPRVSTYVHLQGHWEFPDETRKEINNWLKTKVKLPTSWGSGFRKAYSQSKQNDKKAPAMKAHANLVFVGCGLLSVTAAWPRPLRAQSNQRVVKFMKAYQQAHRAITSETLRAEVGYEVGGRSK